MSERVENPVSVAPWLHVRGSARAVEFYKAAFGAMEVYRVGDGEEVVCRLTLGATEFWVSEESPEHENFSPETLKGGTANLILTVPDPDASFARAVGAGARAVGAVKDEHGWRLGRVMDPFGHSWEVGRPPAQS